MSRRTQRRKHIMGGRSSLGLDGGRGAFVPNAVTLATTNPLWAVAAASGQTGDGLFGPVTWQAGATTGAEASDPTFTTPYWSFDGAQYVSVDHATDAALPTMGTADAWTAMVVFRIAAAPGATSQIFSTKPSSGLASSLGLFVGLTSTGLFRGAVGDGTNGTTTSTVGMDVTANVWSVGFVFTDNVTDVRTRLNGTLSSSSARPVGSQTPTFTTFIARLASNLNSVSQTLTGDIRCVAVWQRQLSSTEMTGLERVFGAGT